jgi:hypothetical protein
VPVIAGGVPPPDDELDEELLEVELLELLEDELLDELLEDEELEELLDELPHDHCSRSRPEALVLESERLVPLPFRFCMRYVSLFLTPGQ